MNVEVPVTPPALSPRGSFLVTVAMLGIYNVARHLGLFGSQELVAAGVLTAGLIGVARLARLSTDDLGLARSRLPGGAVLGGIAFVFVAVAIVVVALVPATAGFLDDERVDVSSAGLVYEVVVTILLVTVIPEELAFRGVLLASGSTQWGVRWAVLATSALFGLWHISPALTTASANTDVSEVTMASSGALAAVTVSVAATFVAGLVFCWLRLRSRSLLAPVLAHFATNAVAFVTAWVLAR